MLEPAEVSRRIKAARELRDMSQTQLADLFDNDGLNRSDPGRLERMDPKVPFMPAHRAALVRHLRVPERWFTAETVDEIVGLGDGPSEDETVEAAVAKLSEATAAMRVVARRLGIDVGLRDLQLSAAKDPPRADLGADQ